MELDDYEFDIPILPRVGNDEKDNISGEFNSLLIRYCESSGTEKSYAIETIKDIMNSQSKGIDVENDLFNVLGDAGVELTFFILQHTKEVGEYLRNQRGEVDQNEPEITSTPANTALDDVNIGWMLEAGFSEEYIARERRLGLKGGAKKNVASPDTWLEGLLPAGTKEYHEKVGLPSNTVRKHGQGFEEVHIPAPLKSPLLRQTDDLITISSIPESWVSLVFPDTVRLNRIQSTVFDVAYNSAANMLICAPTGAGKTNIAMLTLLQLVKPHVEAVDDAPGSQSVKPKPASPRFIVQEREQLKAVYIAPMKALAQEVVEKFSARLKPLGLVVKEFTGDTQLSRQEVAEANLIVTTPEKVSFFLFVCCRVLMGYGSVGCGDAERWRWIARYSGVTHHHR